MERVIIISTLLQLFKASIAIVMVWGLLRLFDLSAGIVFKEVMDEIRKDPVALAQYHGLRAVAFCLLVGRFIS